MQESPDHKDVVAPDDLSVVLGFTQMLSDGGNVDEVSRLATDNGWLDASGQLTAAGNQLARALLQQSGTRDIPCLVSLCPPASVGHPPVCAEN